MLRGKSSELPSYLLAQDDSFDALTLLDEQKAIESMCQHVLISIPRPTSTQNLGNWLPQPPASSLLHLHL